MTEIQRKVTINCATGEQVIEALTPEEIAIREEQIAAAQIAEAERLATEEAKTAKKAAVLAAIAEATGLTAEDISEALA